MVEAYIPPTISRMVKTYFHYLGIIQLIIFRSQFSTTVHRGIVIFVRWALARHRAMLRILNCPTHNSHITEHHSVMHRAHEKGFGRWWKRHLRLMASSTSSTNPLRNTRHTMRLINSRFIIVVIINLLFFDIIVGTLTNEESDIHSFTV